MQFSKVPQHGTVRTNFLRCMIGPQFMKLLFVFPEYEYMTRLAIDLQAFVRCGSPGSGKQFSICVDT